MDMTDIFRTFHSLDVNITLLSLTHEIFSRIKHVLSQKARLIELKKKERKYNMYFVRPQRNKIRNNQEEHKKICKYIEIE